MPCRFDSGQPHQHTQRGTMSDIDSKEFVFDTSVEAIQRKEQFFGKFKKSLTHKFFGSATKTYIEPQQYVAEYENGYSTSTICNEMSYGGQSGLWEIMVMKNDEPINVEGITDGDTVVGYLTTEQAIEIHEKVKSLI